MDYLKLLVRKLGEDFAIVVPCIGLGSVDCRFMSAPAFLFSANLELQLAYRWEAPTNPGIFALRFGRLVQLLLYRRWVPPSRSSKPFGD